MAITLRDECILDQWSTVVFDAAGHARQVLDAVCDHLAHAQMPLACRWSVELISGQGFFARQQRPFLVIWVGQFRDYRILVGIRDFGVHLDCCRFLVAQPGFFKRWFSKKLSGDPFYLSRNYNILEFQDFRAWATIVHSAVVDGVRNAANGLGLDTSAIPTGSKGILEQW